MKGLSLLDTFRAVPMNLVIAYMISKGFYSIFREISEQMSPELALLHNIYQHEGFSFGEKFYGITTYVEQVVNK